MASVPTGSYDSVDALDQAGADGSALLTPAQGAAPATSDASAGADTSASPDGADSEASTEIISQAPLITFLPQSVVQNNGIYVTVDDIITLYVHNFVPGLQAVWYTLRMLMPDGTITLSTIVVNGPPSNGAVASQTMAPAEGFILTGGVFLPGGESVVRGQLYVELRIYRGSGSSTVEFIQLAAGYHCNQQHPSWPDPEFEHPESGQGWVQSLQGPAPAAGVQFQIASPSKVFRRLHSLRFSLTTAAGGAARPLAVAITDGANYLYEVAFPTPQPASSTWIYALARGCAAGSNGVDHQWAPLPNECVLLPGWTIQTSSVLGSADQLSVQQYQVEDLLLAGAG